MPMIDADGCRIHVEVEGPADAPVLMLSNSLGTDLHMWDAQAAAFAAQFRLVRYDRRGHGQSDAPKGPYSMERLGRDALAVLDALSDLATEVSDQLGDRRVTVRLDGRETVVEVHDGPAPESETPPPTFEEVTGDISRVTLRDAMGDRRAEIETQVAELMQRILNGYRGGIQIQGVAIKQADPPDAVNDAFKQVTAAQQDAKSYINQANAYALQITAKAQGEATAFDKVYEQYKLAPGVTRRRMYYETMERILQGVDKTIVEAPGVNSYLPINELKRSAPATEPAR